MFLSLFRLQRESQNPLLVNMNEDISEEANKITKAKQWFQKVGIPGLRQTEKPFYDFNFSFLVNRIAYIFSI